VEVRVGRREGLPRAAVVNCDWLVTLPKADLIERADVLSRHKMRQIDDALKFGLGLDDER
jgi:mRNA-degrading endonuclease toxin of MazEF toxin-antitoxin module